MLWSPRWGTSDVPNLGGSRVTCQQGAVTVHIHVHTCICVQGHVESVTSKMCRATNQLLVKSYTVLSSVMCTTMCNCSDQAQDFVMFNE